MTYDRPRTQTISRMLADFALDLDLATVPEEARTRSKHLILDAIGIAFASHRNEFTGIMTSGLQALHEGGTSPVIGSDLTFTVRNSVLMNAALMHGLDYDDTHMKGIVHATAFCAPVALGVTQEIGGSGRDALAAYIAGMEASIRIGAAAKGGFHHAGFHPTGLIAHFAAALIAGRLYGLTAGQVAAAQGIAASTASAVQVFLEEGTWSKRIHPGWGGVGGITAARLAQAGFLAPSRPYEGRYGFFEAHLQDHASEVDYGVITEGLGSVWEVEAMAIKPYPVCHFIHALAEAAGDLSASGQIDLDGITRIRALIPQETMTIVTEPTSKKRRPTTSYEAKFSAQFVTAASLVRGRFGLAELEPDVLSDERILAISERVECVGDPDTLFPAFYSGGVIVNTRDGREHRRYHRINKGAGERALTNAEIVEKYMETATQSLTASRAETVRDAVLTLEEHGMAEIWRTLGRT